MIGSELLLNITGVELNNDPGFTSKITKPTGTEQTQYKEATASQSRLCTLDEVAQEFHKVHEDLKT